MPSAEESLEAILEKGFKCHQNGQLTEATDCYRRVLAAEPENVDALYLLGGVHFMSNDYTEAVTYFADAIRIEPDFYPAYRMLGDAHKNLGNWDDSIKSFQHALEFEPDNADVWNQLGLVLREVGDVNGSQQAFAKKVDIKYRLGEAAPSDDIDFTYTSRSKLKHDIEQIRYLMSRGTIDKHHEETVALYKDLFDNFPENPTDPHASPIPDSLRSAFSPTYNRHINYVDTASFDGHTINPNLSREEIEADYEKNNPGITYFDDFLTPEALDALWRFCLDSSIWHEFRYPDGYLGAFIESGFFCPLVARIVEELPKALPGIFKDHNLINLWGYKYDSQMTGINLHADEAAVNVNFWITPDEANLKPKTGGLVVWDKEAPLDWNFQKYNADQNAMRKFLEQSQAKPIRIPHKQNRVVIFNSDLFHKSDDIHFKDGYENRRINVTLLYGWRHLA